MDINGRVFQPDCPGCRWALGYDIGTGSDLCHACEAEGLREHVGPLIEARDARDGLRAALGRVLEPVLRWLREVGW